MRRAGHADGNALFTAILESRSGVTFTVHEYSDDFALIAHPDHKIALEMPEMLSEIAALRDAPSALTTPDFPLVLSAGERRAYTANDILRDPSWRKRDADGALRVSVEDAQALILRVLEVPNPGIGDQRFAAPGEELVQQRQVRPVVQHIGDQDQVEPIGLGEEVC